MVCGQSGVVGSIATCSAADERSPARVNAVDGMMKQPWVKFGGNPNWAMFRSVPLSTVVEPPVGLDVLANVDTNTKIGCWVGSLGTIERLADCETKRSLPAANGPGPPRLPPTGT